jgi:hypothetical protein
MRASILLAVVLPLAAADYPQAEISNGLIRARLHLPDPAKGSYNGTRFDWSGIIYSLEFKGHEYFGKWYERHDPKIHDAITGPVEEFRTGDAGLGYAEAAPGGTFVRIGAGVVRKPEEKAYETFRTYDIVDSGRWTEKRGKDWISFTHRLSAPGGYAYEYTKTVRLKKGKPQLVLEHALRNTGDRTIETSQYNHNFFVIDNETVGPDVAVRFAFAPRAKASFKGLAELRGRELAYTRELVKGESVFSELDGFSATEKDYEFWIENRKSGAGVHIKGDHPLSKLVFWSIRSVACPEPYISLRAEPGKAVKWKITYDFYVNER